MKLKELLSQIHILEASADLELEISGVAYDSREVTPGCLFVAISGFASDGNQYIPMAMEKGAVAVVTAVRPQEKIPYILVESDRLALALIGAAYYGYPARDMTIIGVTGTNGKTSVTLLLKQVLEAVTGQKVGLIGTMENLIGQVSLPTERTTPESFALQGLFAQMRDAGCKYVVMEVSSHAISLERVGGITFDVAAFTNLSEDHLDFHKTMEEYCRTKAALFTRCKKAVLNQDDPWYPQMAEGATCPCITTGVWSQSDLRARDIALDARGIELTACCQQEEARVSVGIPGRFTVYNVLTVLGIAKALGISLAQAAMALKDAKGVRGRVEVVPTPGKDYTVLIDYAHTPDGLENVLRSVRDFCKGRLIVVFGCGGNRDPIKRPIMGRIGVGLSDFAVITSDNPRNEVPMDIIQDILQGVDAPKEAYAVIENRRDAIVYAMDKAEKNDIIVLAGKGHETYQEIRGVKYPLDERQEVAAYLKK